MKASDQLLPHLFRTEYSRIVAVLCRMWGLEHIEAAEDIASETFLTALQTWPYQGVPPNPQAWLFTVAKNKSRNYFNRLSHFQNKIAGDLKHEAGDPGDYFSDLSEKNIHDSQLQMLFAVCHPAINFESQVTLALRVLCGFGIDEIASAFLTNREVVTKRLYRAKEKWKQLNIRLEFPGEKEIPQRIGAVLTTLYLLFNEGYYSETHEKILREELCVEAMTLSFLLTHHETTNLPEVNALLALMCFHSSRFPARRDASGGILLYDEQDERLWNSELITKGIQYLNKAASGSRLSRYHLEAMIAYWFTIKNDSGEKWESVLDLYNRLLMIEYSPVIALNRTYALAKVKGKQTALQEALKLKLETNPYYHSLLAELFTGIDNNSARKAFETAIGLAKTDADRKILGKKLSVLLGS